MAPGVLFPPPSSPRQTTRPAHKSSATAPSTRTCGVVADRRRLKGRRVQSPAAPASLARSLLEEAAATRGTPWCGVGGWVAADEE